MPLKEKRVAGVQTLSGTGGLRVFGEVLHQFGHKHIYVVSLPFDSSWPGTYINIDDEKGHSCFFFHLHIAEPNMGKPHPDFYKCRS